MLEQQNVQVFIKISTDYFKGQQHAGNRETFIQAIRYRQWDEWFLETPNPEALHRAQAHPKIPTYFLNDKFLKTNRDPAIHDYVDTPATRASSITRYRIPPLVELGLCG